MRFSPAVYTVSEFPSHRGQSEWILISILIQQIAYLAHCIVWYTVVVLQKVEAVRICHIEKNKKRTCSYLKHLQFCDNIMSYLSTLPPRHSLWGSKLVWESLLLFLLVVFWSDVVWFDIWGLTLWSITCTVCMVPCHQELSFATLSVESQSLRKSSVTLLRLINALCFLDIVMMWSYTFSTGLVGFTFLLQKIQWSLKTCILC